MLKTIKSRYFMITKRLYKTKHVMKNMSESYYKIMHAI